MPLHAHCLTCLVTESETILCHNIQKKLGQLVLKLFSNVERKTGRSRGNWQKVTQRYYGIKWSQTQLPSSSNNEHVLAWTDTPSCLPSGFFMLKEKQGAAEVIGKK
jgi:hypothetical protein